MRTELLDEAIELLEKANADLEPQLVSAPLARKLLCAYARAEKLAAFGVAALAPKLADAPELARVTGTSLGKAKAVVATGKVLKASDELNAALEHGEVSLDQAAEIAAAEDSAPGSARELVATARDKPFHALKDKARTTKLEAEQHKDLAAPARPRPPGSTSPSSATSPTPTARSWRALTPDEAAAPSSSCS